MVQLTVLIKLSSNKTLKLLNCLLNWEKAYKGKHYYSYLGIPIDGALRLRDTGLHRASQWIHGWERCEPEMTTKLTNHSVIHYAAIGEHKIFNFHLPILPHILSRSNIFPGWIGSFYLLYLFNLCMCIAIVFSLKKMAFPVPTYSLWISPLSSRS